MSKRLPNPFGRLFDSAGKVEYRFGDILSRSCRLSIRPENKIYTTILAIKFRPRSCHAKGNGPYFLYDNPEEEYYHEVNPFKFEVEEGSKDTTLEYEEFQNDIDIRGGFLAHTMENFAEFIGGEKQAEYETRMRIACSCPDGATIVSSMPQLLTPSQEDVEPYREHYRTEKAKRLNEDLFLVREWLRNPKQKPKLMTDRKYQSFVAFAKKFFFDNDRMYRRDSDGQHRLVVAKED